MYCHNIKLLGFEIKYEVINICFLRNSDFSYFSSNFLKFILLWNFSIRRT